MSAKFLATGALGALCRAYGSTLKNAGHSGPKTHWAISRWAGWVGYTCNCSCELLIASYYCKEADLTKLHGKNSCLSPPLEECMNQNILLWFLRLAAARHMPAVPN